MLIALVGRAGSGKTTVARLLTSAHGFREESFSAPLKDAVASAFGWERRMLDGDTPESRAWREQVDRWWATRLNMPALTPRFVLQYVGTDLLRAGFHEDIWVASLQRRLHRYSTEERVVVSDIRFPNEAEAVRLAGGLVVRVVRSVERGTHASEAGGDAIEADRELQNDGTLEELRAHIDSLVESLL